MLKQVGSLWTFDEKQYYPQVQNWYQLDLRYFVIILGLQHTLWKVLILNIKLILRINNNCNILKTTAYLSNHGSVCQPSHFTRCE